MTCRSKKRNHRKNRTQNRTQNRRKRRKTPKSGGRQALAAAHQPLEKVSLVRLCQTALGASSAGPGTPHISLEPQGSAPADSALRPPANKPRLSIQSPQTIQIRSVFNIEPPVFAVFDPEHNNYIEIKVKKRAPKRQNAKNTLKQLTLTPPPIIIVSF